MFTHRPGSTVYTKQHVQDARPAECSGSSSHSHSQRRPPPRSCPDIRSFVPLITSSVITISRWPEETARQSVRSYFGTRTSCYLLCVTHEQSRLHCVQIRSTKGRHSLTRIVGQCMRLVTFVSFHNTRHKYGLITVFSPTISVIWSISVR